MISVLNAGKDRDIFVKKNLGAKVLYSSKMAMKKHKCRRLKNMIKRGVDVLFVIIPYNGQVLSNVVKEAKQEGR